MLNHFFLIPKITINKELCIKFSELRYICKNVKELLTIKKIVNYHVSFVKMLTTNAYKKM